MTVWQAIRVLNRREPAPGEESMALLWERLGWRAFMAVAGVLVILALLEYRDRPGLRLSFPRVERTVAASLWML